jgi:TonB family protein
MDPADIQTLIRSHYDAFRRCYEQGLARKPGLSGRVVVRFVIERDGKVSSVAVEDSTDLGDKEVVQCLVREYETLVFPAPLGGIVTVVYPIMFSPG